VHEGLRSADADDRYSLSLGKSHDVASRVSYTGQDELAPTERMAEVDSRGRTDRKGELVYGRGGCEGDRLLETACIRRTSLTNFTGAVASTEGVAPMAEAKTLRAGTGSVKTV
jgi:hypothetical protein